MNQNSSFITEMKQDEYLTARSDAGATEVKQLNLVGPTRDRASSPANLIESFTLEPSLSLRPDFKRNIYLRRIYIMKFRFINRVFDKKKKENS